MTCTAQSTLVTGLMPSGHGAVANGWYFRDLSEVWLWRQSNRLVAGEKIWEAGKAREDGRNRRPHVAARGDRDEVDLRVRKEEADEVAARVSAGSEDRCLDALHVWEPG